VKHPVLQYFVAMIHERQNDPITLVTTTCICTTRHFTWQLLCHHWLSVTYS